MRRMLAMLLLLAVMMCSTAQGQELVQEMLGEEEMGAIAQVDFPGWQIWRNSWYGSGMWEDEMTIHSDIELLRVTEDQLLIRHLDVVRNGLKQGDPIPWEVTDYAPVPLTQEAAERFAGMSPDAIMERYNGPEVNADELDGCAEFLLGEGETMTELYVYPDFLVAVTQDAEGREGLRIGHWNGTEYEKVTASPMQTQDIYIVSVHSYNDYLELQIDGADIVLCCGEDGQWVLAHVTAYDEDYNETAYSIGTDGISVYDYLYSDYRNNDRLYYGRPTFPTLLDGLSFDDVPMEIDEVPALLDTTGFACVKTEGAVMYDAPEGNALASCYARLTGAVLQEQDGWVQMQIGSAEQGMTAWFRAEDMAFGAEVNEVVCSFPSYDDEAWWDMEDMSAILPEHGAELDPWTTELWLIARLPDGGWLALVNGEMVCEAAAEAIGEVGPTYHAWDEEDW